MHNNTPQQITINDALNLSCGLQWVAIPDKIKRALNIDSRLGICGGMFITRQSAIGAQRFIHNINNHTNTISLKECNK